MLLTDGMANRWAYSDGSLQLPFDGSGTVAVECGEESESATVADGLATLTAAQAATLMPSVGVYTLDWGGVADTQVERVNVRYTTRDEIVAYGQRNGDGFDNTNRYPVADVEAAIAAAEEVIEMGTRRSFCKRALTLDLLEGLNELPCEDAISASDGTLLHGRQVRCDEDTEDVLIVYGAPLDQRIRDAATMLAASYLRPRVGAENVRGQSMDGVYVSYTLATGEEGGETGLPEVDAVIASHRSRRSVVM